MTQGLGSLTEPAFQQNPHPTYARWRAESPVRREVLPSGLTAWVVTRYDDARKALADPRLTKAVPDTRVSADIAGPVSQHMLAADPPDHTRLRRLVSAAFTARRIEELRPRIEQITEGLLDDMAGRERVDLLDAYAFPLPIQVICELLGIPSDDRDAFREWSNVIVAGSQSGPRLPGAIGSLVAYIRNLLSERRAGGGDDLISGLLAARDDDDRLSEDELTSMVFLLLIAGHETTVNLIGNGVWLLLSERERWERLRADPSLLPAAIEEFLRYESPVETATMRFAAEDLEIGGQPVGKGDPVLVVLLSANRDFPGADELRFDRGHNAHLAFGHGIHYCLGAPLARLEAQVAFGRLLERFPDLRLAGDEPVWRPGLLLRGLDALPVHLR